MVKEIKEELSKEEEKNKIEYSKLQKLYAERHNKYQGKPMSQVESEAARADLMQLQQTIKSKQDELDEKFRELYVRRQQEVKTKIENFLKEYNKSKGFTYILKNVPEIMYYKDSVYDITSDVIKGLNERFPVKKK
jgi:outer membrane protein